MSNPDKKDLSSDSHKLGIELETNNFNRYILELEIPAFAGMTAWRVRRAGPAELVGMVVWQKLGDLRVQVPPKSGAILYPSLFGYFFIKEKVMKRW